MRIEFQENEFTRTEILEYLTKAYGRQLNCNRFSTYNLNNWTRVGKIPDLYGGHRILKVERIEELRRLKVYTLEGLTREIAKDVDLLNNPKKQIPKKFLNKNSLVRKHRTQYYYDILKKAGKQYTRKTIEQSILPDNWKIRGIKQNQLARRKR